MSPFSVDNMNAIEFAYTMFCRRRFPLPLEDQVTDLEHRIGVDLPGDYRRFLLHYNGGYFTEPQIVPQVQDCPTDRLRYMMGIRATHPSAELASEDDLRLFDDNDPLQVLPIGCTLMGNLIILITRFESRGSILLKRDVLR